MLQTALISLGIWTTNLNVDDSYIYKTILYTMTHFECLWTIIFSGDQWMFRPTKL